MNFIGYTLAAIGLYCLYDGLIFVGASLFLVGGFLSGGFTVGLSCISILSLVSSLAYGFNNEFTTAVIILCIVSALLAAVSRGSGYWEFGLFDLGDFGGDSGGDGGSSCGGGD